MEDTLISFETAKLAKEKKFDILCEHSFSEHNSAIQENNQNGFRNWNKEYKNSYSRPTQSLLTKWLREVHSIIVDATLDFFDSYTKESIKYSPTFYTYSNDKKRFWTYTDYINSDECTKEMQDEMPIFQKYSTYEEALEIGLQEGLKLIK